jgi:spore coat protein CotH
VGSQPRLRNLARGGGFRDAGGQGDFSPPQRFDPGGVPGTADGALSGDFETLQQDAGAEGLAPPARPNVGDNVAPGGARGFPAGPGDASNILVARFLANETWQALYEQKLDNLRASLYENGVAGDVLDSWADLLRSEAGGLVDSIARFPA